MKQVLFIINKKSGTSTKKDFPGLVKKTLDGRLFAYDIALTGYAGHAEELSAAAAAAGVDTVVAVGGDGTVNEVARGLVGSHTTLSIIPKGSGNGLARALGIPRDDLKAMALIGHSRTLAIDTGLANGHLFLSNAGVGFDALIAERFSHSGNRGLWNYARLTMHSFRHYKPLLYHLRVDGQPLQLPAFLITAANGNQYGYNFQIAPHAFLDDGLLDLCIMRPFRWSAFPGIAYRSLSGTLEKSVYTQYMRCKELVITCEEGLQWMQVDGDPSAVRDNQVTITLRHQALNILVPLSTKPTKHDGGGPSRID